MQDKIITVTAFFSGSPALERPTKQVNEAVAIGWEPVGGRVVLGGRRIQPMVKRR